MIDKIKQFLRIGYFPYIPANIDIDRLVGQIAAFFQLEKRVVKEHWDSYSQFAKEKQYEKKLGDSKTLSHEEAFIQYLISRYYRPASVVEIGTQYGKSTRRLIDIREKLNADFDITCFDIEDVVQYFEHPSEAILNLTDVTETVRNSVLEAYPPGLIYLDAHPYQLLHNVIISVLESQDWILTIHDCGPGLCNPNMRISKEDSALITSRTGHWERHVLAEIFGVDNPLDSSLDDRETETHRLRVFETPHGLAVIMPKSLNL